MYYTTDYKTTDRYYPGRYPGVTDADKIAVGDFIRIRFAEDGIGAEMMWVKVTKIDGDTYSGTLDNEPVVLKTVKYADNVGPFRRTDILQLLRANEPVQPLAGSNLVQLDKDRTA